MNLPLPTLLLVLSLSAGAPLILGNEKLPRPIQQIKDQQQKQRFISVDELKAELKSSSPPTIVDLRSEDERKQFGYIAGSVNLDYLGSDFEAQFKKVYPDKNARLILMCAVGGRAALAYEDLKALGYKHLVRVEGCFNNYKASGGAIVPGKK